MRQREAESSGDPARTRAERRQVPRVSGERVAAVVDAETRENRLRTERIRHATQRGGRAQAGQREQSPTSPRPAHPAAKSSLRSVRSPLQMLLRCETADELAQRKLLLRRAARAVVAAAAIAAASVATWFVAIWVIGALGGPGPDVQAATGLLAVAVLVVVMNWFFHKVYWTA